MTSQGCTDQPSESISCLTVSAQLSGGRKGTCSVRITANWRITFEWDGEDAVRVDHEDYH